MSTINKVSFGKALMMLFATLFMVSCGSDDPVKPDGYDPIKVDFAVISDCHYFKASLGTEGKAFEEYIHSDRKLVAESQAINEAAIELLKKEPVEFVLVSGDLTKDGEKESHIEFAKLLNILEVYGKKVYVVPGNHDINNPHAMRFEGDQKIPVDRVNPEEFVEIYKEYGFGEALYRDPNSLSYIVEPKPGLWIFCLDDNKYDNNITLGVPETSGRYKKETMDWIMKHLAIAREKNKIVIGMQHHGLVEHFAGQSHYPVSKEYVIDDWEEVARKFIAGDMKAIFTGHFHANDVTKYQINIGEIHDIQTGSFVTAPCPYRIVNLDEKSIRLTPKFIEEIKFDTKGMSFQDYATNFIRTGMVGFVVQYLVSNGISEDIAKEIAPYGIEAFIAHYKGDEVLPEKTRQFVEKLNEMKDARVKLLAAMIKSLYRDINPTDNYTWIEIKRRI